MSYCQHELFDFEIGDWRSNLTTLEHNYHLTEVKWRTKPFSVNSPHTFRNRDPLVRVTTNLCTIGLLVNWHNRGLQIIKCCRTYLDFVSRLVFKWVLSCTTRRPCHEIHTGLTSGDVGDGKERLRHTLGTFTVDPYVHETPINHRGRIPSTLFRLPIKIHDYYFWIIFFLKNQVFFWLHDGLSI